MKNARYLLVGSYLTHGSNVDIQIGEFFRINLTLSPFNLTGYVRVFNESMADHHDVQKSLILYDIQYLKTFDFDQSRRDLIAQAAAAQSEVTTLQD